MKDKPPDRIWISTLFYTGTYFKFGSYCSKKYGTNIIEYVRVKKKKRKVK